MQSVVLVKTGTEHRKVSYCRQTAHVTQTQTRADGVVDRVKQFPPVMLTRTGHARTRTRIRTKPTRTRTRT